ncbi:glycosyltransferase family 4 protein [Haloferax larsenii]|uniref:Glycosyltransferase family 4 protein n=1 Tax=Haloferax larsenii TaxID=302484 RepID=A0ABY5RCL1_HALLR|nr:glycosyltransferase family 4 protein [Haloferax larsenii]UVE49765.1 glycosyltransferase family 4 protein [Haloferax larsenii]
MSRHLVSLVDAVQVWDSRTHEEFERYVDTDLERVWEIPHGNYVPLYDDASIPTRKDAREALGLSETERVYLYFGVIRPYKQVPELIRTFEKKESDATLLIAGNPVNDALESELVELAAGAQNVSLELAYIPDREVPSYFAAADAVVLPYAHIFNSGSVLLAMSFGRAFVAPSIGCIPSVDSGGNIVYDDLAGALDTLDDTPLAELERVGKRNARVAQEVHDWDAVATKYAEMYDGDSS